MLSNNKICLLTESLVFFEELFWSMDNKLK